MKMKCHCGRKLKSNWMMSHLEIVCQNALRLETRTTWLRINKEKLNFMKFLNWFEKKWKTLNALIVVVSLVTLLECIQICMNEEELNWFTGSPITNSKLIVNCAHKMKTIFWKWTQVFALHECTEKNIVKYVKVLPLMGF